MAQSIPSGDNSMLRDTVSTRHIGRVERFLGPDNYRILLGLIKTPASIAGSTIILLFVLVAIFAPVIIPPVNKNDPYSIPRDGFKSDPQPVGAEWRRNVPDLPFWYTPLTGKTKWVHIMGTSEGQYDIFYGVIWGTRTAFVASILVTFSTVIIGIIYGAIAAYYGGIVDMVLMRIVDVLSILPGILAALILAAVLTPTLGKSTIPVMIALIAFGWMGYARFIRADILSVRERDYILAARVVGVKDSRILFQHILPNAIFPTIILASLAIGDVILSFAGLSFLGIGAEIGYADWGQLISFARNWITSLNTYWYIIVFPGFVLVLYVMGWNLIGDALRDVLDPRMRGKT
ncbi:MAG: ABC transporter permease [Anaerolineales bacterium]